MSGRPRIAWLWDGAILLLGALLILLLYAALARQVVPRVLPERPEPHAGLFGAVIQLEVRNGTGVPRLAQRVTEYLQERGFDVVEYGNHDRFDVPETLVISRTGDQEAARRVAVALGLDPERVLRQPDPQAYLDVTVILGADYRTLKPMREGYGILP
ncbi:MAG: LytR C-terminal domain-containing protein [Bacteroidetes bacterium]|nr:LytR C-terminal domain-containing protein [Rhodothermia bacterium]MCS7155597.1 LytR C-terminal domain-containing protein [Bacteroidota bacterium]MCX7906455.1 LytR C-terminal domain-containing protein [Bacteroidota bacterium]MDW8137263.1 LytR C-terminal domain-containing protein [Bacteroidota bacterium]MDW8284867.1 LytR C-terminal domain-containing protein [Bacteroidota bacterium]